MTIENLPKLKLQSIVESANVAKGLEPSVLGAVGKQVVDDYNKDKSTRSVWEQRSAEALKLALQVAEAKTFPWPNCSNVKFPLLTIAALQFLARVSILTKGRKLVKVEAIGQDVDGKKAAQCKRISTHMSMQLTEGDLNWIDSDEQMKLSASIVGAAFKKTYYDGISGQNISEHVPAMNIVLDYYCKDIAKASRITHLIPMTANTIQEKVRQGLFLKMVDTTPGSREMSDLRQTADEVQGLKDPSDGTEFEILEQHCWLDLDGDDYEEPYIISVRRDTGQCLRIVARFLDEGDVHRVNDGLIRKLEAQARESGDNVMLSSKLEKEIDRLEKAAGNHIVRIDPMQYFTRTLFIPAPDGGVYGLGFGALLGPMNAAVDSLVNQLIDAGTMSNGAGGFLGRGVKMKGGSTAFSPFEWKPVDSTGDDLRKNIFPLPVREPSTVLFQLLGMLVSYGEKISGATDIMTGVSPGQNTPAETSRNTVEQGMMLFSGIYTRMYRSFKEEMRKMYELNRLYLKTSPQFEELTSGPNAIIAPDDYQSNAMRVFPAASAEAVSSTQRKEKAAMLLQLAGSQPGFNRYKVTRDYLEACDYEDIDVIFPDPQGPNAIAPPKNPKMEIEMGKLQLAQKEHEDDFKLAVAQMQSDAVVNEAKVNELQAKATKLLSEADGVSTGHQIAIINAQLGAAKAKQEGLLGALALMQKAEDSHMKQQQQGAKDGKGSGQEGMGAPPGNA